ncbi:MAG: hypothetical protein QW754_04565 [Thermoplasmata archaeon]
MEITIYIRNEISLADLSIIIFMNCGIKEEVVSTPATNPIISIISIDPDRIE